MLQGVSAMKANALYYPYIDVPNGKWLLQSLLYWDKMMSIVPGEYMYKPEKHSELMRRLLENELVEAVIPGVYLGSEELDKFADLIEARIRKGGIQRMLGPYGRAGDPSEVFRKKNEISKIHIEKLGHIARRLQAMGVAEPCGGAWYKMPRRVASGFMFFIAHSIARKDVVNANPITGKDYWVRLGANQRGEVRREVINFLLPIPDGKIDIDAVSIFKQQHGKLISRFRRFVDGEITRIQSAVKSGDSYEDVKRDAIMVMGERTEEIKDAMKSKWKTVIFKKIVPLCVAGAPCVFAGVPPELGLAGVIASWFGNSGVDVEREPLSYSVFAQEMMRVGW